ncbi:MAG: copper resistance protein B [Sphingosinicella sp.]
MRAALRPAWLAFYGDRLEWIPEGNGMAWDVSAELGNQEGRFWLATSGSATFGGPIDLFEAQALFSRPISEAGLAFQIGYRRDFEPRPRRSYLAAGVQGNVDERLYVGAFGFLSTRGELIGRAFGWYDQPIGGRLVLQPAFETEISAQDAPSLGIGRGPIFVEAGARLRLRLAEAFSPYFGFNWFRLVGRTADIARASGDDLDTANFVVGIRSYF